MLFHFAFSASKKLLHSIRNCKRIYENKTLSIFYPCKIAQHIKYEVQIFKTYSIPLDLKHLFVFSKYFYLFIIPTDDYGLQIRHFHGPYKH